MAVREFPALGFDPAPGDAAALESTASAVRSVADVVGGAGDRVGRLDASGWIGGAADAFRGQLADLPRDLDVAAKAHDATARALAGYATGLAARQRRATELESRAAILRRQELTAVAEVDHLAASTAPAGSPAHAALRDRYDAARHRATTIGTALQQVVADAGRLRTEHRTAAAEAARTIRAATEAPYDEPGWLSRTGSGIKAWITDHADVLASISAALKGVSAVLGVLSFVPGLQFLAPFAMAAGTTALLIDGVLCVAGKGDWRIFALDAALTLLPTGPVVRTVRRVPGATRVLKGANALIPPAAKGRLFRAVGNLPEGVTATQLDEAARLIRSRAAHLGDDVVIQGSRAGYSAHTGSDIDFGIRVSPDRFDELIAKAFKSPNPGSAKERTMLMSVTNGRIHTGESRLGALRNELEIVLGREVDLSVIRRSGPFDNEPWLRLP